MKMILFIALLWSTGPVCNLLNENIAISTNDGDGNTGDKSPVRPPFPPIPPIPPIPPTLP